jgi:hypothetical protein
VVSFVTVTGLIHATMGCLKEDAMLDRFARRSWPWFTAGSLAFFVFLGLLLQRDFRPPVGLGVFIVVSTVLAVAALPSVRLRGDAHVIWRVGLACGVLVTIVLLTRLLFDVFAPVDPLDRFLAQARDDYSEFNYPRRWMPAAGVTLILMGGGLLAACRTGRVGTGTLGAVLASASGSGLYVVLVALANLLPLGPRDPLGNAPHYLQFFGNAPAMLIPVLVMFSTVLGTIGALFGRALRAGKPAGSHG